MKDKAKAVDKIEETFGVIDKVCVLGEAFRVIVEVSLWNFFVIADLENFFVTADLDSVGSQILISYLFDFPRTLRAPHRRDCCKEV